MDNQENTKESVFKKKNIQLAVIILLSLIVVTSILVYLKIFKLPSTVSIPTLQKQAAINLKSEYKNPLKKETQYVNPFDKYKNPFVVNK